jgi:hypothetical protein
VAAELSRRLTGIFLKDKSRDGRRPVFGDREYFQRDEHWRDCIPFHEFFHGDSGAGLGASHQTGWTALVALLLQYGGALRFDARPDAGRGPPRSDRMSPIPADALVSLRCSRRSCRSSPVVGVCL